MKAIRQHAFGGPGELRLEDVPDPRPAEGQVRIRVQAADVHLLDTVIRRGEARPRAMPALPITPGREVAGIVDQAGPGTGSAVIGRRVVADLGLASGGYAELALADADSLHDIPASLDADQAVAMIGTGLARDGHPGTRPARPWRYCRGHCRSWRDRHTPCPGCPQRRRHRHRRRRRPG